MFTSPRLGVPLLCALLLPALGLCAETGIVLRNLTGAVEVSPSNHGEWIAARPNLALQVGDAVRTGAAGSAMLVHGPSELFIKPSTTAIVGYQSVQLRQGALWFRMRKTPTGFKFITDVAAATIRGTLGLISTTGEMTHVSLLRGKVEVDTVNRENYMLMPQYEVIARRNRPLQKNAMSGTRTTDLVAEFYSTAKLLGGSTGAAPGAAPSAPPSAPAPETGSFDPAATGRAATTASSAPNPAVAPLITVIDSTTNPVINNAASAIAGSAQLLGGVTSGATTVVGGATSGVATVVGGTTSGATTIVGGVTSGVGTVLGGATSGSVGGLVGGVAGGTTQILGGVTGGTTQILGGVTGGTTQILGGVTGGTTSLLGGVTGGTTQILGGATGGTTPLPGGTTGGSGGLGGLLGR